MRVIWIDSRYHNPKIIGTAWIQVGVEDQGGLRNEKGRNCQFCDERDKSFS